MRFALLGNHPDGMAAARAIAETGRHDLVYVYDASPPDFAPHAKPESDLEELLADPQIEWLIVAVPLNKRGDVLKRALQSEHHVLCVMPCGEKADVAYEAALIQADVKKRLLPILTDATHPAVAAFAEKAAGFRLLIQEIRASQPSRDVGWHRLRAIGGEVVEVGGYACEEHWDATQPVLVHGKFASGALFESRLLIGTGSDSIELRAILPHAEWAITIDPIAGSADLVENGTRAFRFEPWRCGPEVVAAVERAEDREPMTWTAALRGAELDETLRRAIEKRRTFTLDFQEVNEDVGNKSTLTLIGCGMIWLMLLAFAVSIWVPWARWAVVPMIAGFLLLLVVNRLARKR